MFSVYKVNCFNKAKPKHINIRLLVQTCSEPRLCICEYRIGAIDMYQAVHGQNSRSYSAGVIPNTNQHCVNWEFRRHSHYSELDRSEIDLSPKRSEIDLSVNGPLENSSKQLIREERWVTYQTTVDNRRCRMTVQNCNKRPQHTFGFIVYIYRARYLK